MLMKHFLSFLAFVFCLVAHAQSEAQIIQEVKARNINSKQEALDALAEEGISENQARQLARMRGIDFDTFLNTYFRGYNTQSTKAAAPSLPVVSELVVEVPPTEEVERKIKETDSKKAPYFGYKIFQKNPFLEKE